MGGKNHQPCNLPNTSYLRFSTKMSRELSVACSLLEQANIALEDVLLNELDGNGVGGSVVKVTELLSNSQFELTQMLNVIAMLRENMRKHEFKNLPTLQSTDLELLGAQLVSAGIVQDSAWSIVCDMMHRDGFYGMLNYFEQETFQLNILTGSLIIAMLAAEEMARAGKLNFVLEKNQRGNFKVEFATLYSSWHRFQQVFLASSMLSTELWYRYCDAGSLLEPRKDVQAA